MEIYNDKEGGISLVMLVFIFLIHKFCIKN